jgi:hypothetical protein
MTDLTKPTGISQSVAHSMKAREIMAYVALGASILGSAILTLFAVWVIYIIWQGGWPIDTAEQRISILSKALVISLGGSLIVLITLGFVISRRTIKVTKDGFEMQSDASGSEDDDDKGSDEEDSAPVITKTEAMTVSA